MTTTHSPFRRRLIAVSLALPALAAVPARAQAPRAGADYTALNPEIPVETPGKIEVIEFFWYGCPACYQIEPLIEKWIARLSPDTAFRRVPAAFNERWAHDAAIFYAFEALGLTEKLHRPLFDAIHRERLKTNDPQALAQWLARHGVDAKKFDETMKSFGVQNRVRRSNQLVAAYRIEGTPTLAVHGRYTIKVEQAQTFERMIEIADHLIGVTRKSLAARKS
ncbi:MAG: thiol:disulfide interchange protein DsbA/DsbL [Burkholderiales bacterium]|nr:thiol:disulfide interchange protein DsbA/DsbL [Burkholderiales bacterium]